jgi:hypothetical protein
LSRVRKVGLQGEYICVGIRRRDQVQIEDLMAFREQVWDNITASLAAATCEDNALASTGT